jgi:hypothetical protein
LWRWRREFFSEMVAIAWMSSASRLMLDSASRCAAHRYDLRLRETSQFGCFFDWAAHPPIWKMNARACFYVGTMESIARLHPVLASTFASTNEFGFARWNAEKVLPCKIRVKFHGEDSGRLTIAADQASLELLEYGDSVNSTTSNKSIVIPLRLIENPRILDEFIDDWCLP